MVFFQNDIRFLLRRAGYLNRSERPRTGATRAATARDVRGCRAWPRPRRERAMSSGRWRPSDPRWPPSSSSTAPPPTAGTGTSSSPASQAAGHDTLAADLPCDDERSRVRRVRRRRRGGDRAAGRRRRTTTSCSSPSRWAGSRPRSWSTRVPVAMIVLVARDDAGAGRVGRRLVDEHRLTGRRHRDADGGRRACRPSRSTSAAVFLHDVPADVVAAVGGPPSSGQSDTAVRGRRGRSPPGRTCRPASCCAATIACSRPTFQRRVVGERLGIVARRDGRRPPARRSPTPRELADRLLRYVDDLHPAG